MKFTDFNLKDTIQSAITDAGFTEPSPIQKDAIPLVLEGHDIVAQAQTGTGKTAAFGLPIMNMMKADGSVEGLVIVPTRELAMQVSDELFRFGQKSGLKTATVYGGTPYGKQIDRIKQASIVVATPGRLQDLLMSGKIKINPQFVVLDEADEMLDMGFLDEIKNIFSYLPKERQTLMFSATMPSAIRKLAEQILKTPKTISITKAESTNTSITQLYYVVQERERDDALVRLIDYKNPTKCIIFCRMKKEVDRLVAHMTAQGFKVSGLHGDMEQKQREVTIRAFKQGGIDIFIATDVAARGLDVNDVTHVFNYHIPFDSESYVHRIGRTGRAGKKGEAITLVSPNELRTIKRIEKDVGTTMASQVIPTRMEVQNNRADALIAKIAETTVTENAIELVKTLQHDLDIVTIAHLLASLVQEESFVKGKDNIGLGLEEIELLIQRAKQGGGGGGGGRNRGGYRGGNRSGGGGGGRHGRNGRSGGGDRSGGRSSGGRDSRNGGQGSRS
ncbi:MAG: DEAD/DEAH box helicase [Sulfurovum sp.]|uniref:DEAD/DEAH box helicase n=1 Tax=Sulfurovum sp. TaxID=1969726 RepID=UPI0028681E54|nr:DEAD/DEAH box helicase [Sulfurovum sp.]MCO4844729.1 DEAD/DEAH box helicase [Sulfurovum sp.]